MISSLGLYFGGKNACFATFQIFKTFVSGFDISSAQKEPPTVINTDGISKKSRGLPFAKIIPIMILVKPTINPMTVARSIIL